MNKFFYTYLACVYNNELRRKRARVCVYVYLARGANSSNRVYMQVLIVKADIFKKLYILFFLYIDMVYI